MKCIILFAIAATFFTLAVAEETTAATVASTSPAAPVVDKEREKKIVCDSKFNYKVKWGKRYCAANVLEGDLKNVNSTLPEEYLAIFGDNIPRASLVDRDALREWICQDLDNRWEENLKGVVDESTLHCSHKTAVYKQCLMAEDIKMIDEEVCKRKKPHASALAKGFLACLKSHIGEDNDCYKGKITQPLTDENLENWMCISNDNIQKMYQTVFCESNMQKRGHIVQCIDAAYAAMKVE